MRAARDVHRPCRHAAPLHRTLRRAPGHLDLAPTAGSLRALAECRPRPRRRRRPRRGVPVSLVRPAVRVVRVDGLEQHVLRQRRHEHAATIHEAGVGVPRGVPERASLRQHGSERLRGGDAHVGVGVVCGGDDGRAPRVPYDASARTALTRTCASGSRTSCVSADTLGACSESPAATLLSARATCSRTRALVSVGRGSTLRTPAATYGRAMAYAARQRSCGSGAARYARSDATGTGLSFAAASTAAPATDDESPGVASSRSMLPRAGSPIRPSAHAASVAAGGARCAARSSAANEPVSASSPSA